MLRGVSGPGQCVVCARPIADPARAPYVFFRGGRRVFCGHPCRVTFKRAPETFVPMADVVLAPEPARPRPKLFVVRTAGAIESQGGDNPGLGKFDQSVGSVDSDEPED